LIRNFFLVGFGFLLLTGCSLSSRAAEPGFLEGHLQIVSIKVVELGEAGPSKGTIANYADYPLVILSRDGQKEIRQLTADKEGNYREALPPGDYVLDAKGRAPQHIRAKPVSFTVISKQTVRVDFELDTGIR